MHHSDIDKVFTLIRELSRKANIPILGWGSKQDLYRIKEMVDDSIRSSPNFHAESDWLTSREKQRILNILSSKK